MKKLALVVVAVLMAFGVQAQDVKKEKKSPEERTEAKISKMKEVLQLTADQEAKIRPVLQQKQTAMKTFREANKGNKEAIKKENEKQRAISAKAINGVLTPAQQKKWKAYKEEQKKLKKENDED